MQVSRLLFIGQSAQSVALKGLLQAEGFMVEAFDQGAQGIERALSGDYALIVLEVSTAVLSGFEVLCQIRQQSLLPILMISSEPIEAERILALELGADEYLPLPCLRPELLARIRAILRRSSVGASSFGHLLRVSGLELDKLKRTVTRSGEPITLTAAEFDLLVYLVHRSGKAVPREELAQAILGRQLNLSDRSIDVHVSNLRKKLGVSKNGAGEIKAVRGVGYLYLPS